MIGRWISNRYDPERARSVAQSLGGALVFAGTVGLFLSTIGIWPPVVTNFVGVVLMILGITQKAQQMGQGTTMLIIGGCTASERQEEMNLDQIREVDIA